MWDENAQNEEMEGIVTLITDEGEEVRFLCLDVVDYEGEEYAVMSEIVDGEPEQEVVILRAEPVGENGEESFEGVEDEATMKAVFAIFQEHIEQGPSFELPEEAEPEEE